MSQVPSKTGNKIADAINSVMDNVHMPTFRTDNEVKIDEKTGLYMLGAALLVFMVFKK